VDFLLRTLLRVEVVVLTIAMYGKPACFDCGECATWVAQDWHHPSDGSTFLIAHFCDACKERASNIETCVPTKHSRAARRLNILLTKRLLPRGVR
jgi:hypothetical protein